MKALRNALIAFNSRSATLVICNTQRTANADGCWTSLHPHGTIMPFILCRCTSRDHVYADRFLGLLPLIGSKRVSSSAKTFQTGEKS